MSAPVPAFVQQGMSCLLAYLYLGIFPCVTVDLSGKCSNNREKHSRCYVVRNILWTTDDIFSWNHISLRVFPFIILLQQSIHLLNTLLCSSRDFPEGFKFHKSNKGEVQWFLFNLNTEIWSRNDLHKYALQYFQFFVVGL